MRKKKKYLFGGILVIALSGAAINSSQYTNLFSINGHPTKHVSSKEQQLAYLKKHENEIKEFVKSQNPKIESVRIDWEETKWDEIGNGTPQGGGEIVMVYGGFNHISNSSWSAIIQFKDERILIDSIGIGIPLRIGGELFD